MEIKHQKECLEDESTNGRPAMKFFRKFHATCSETMKLKKHYTFEQFRVDKRYIEEAKTRDLILRTQQTSFKCVRKIEWKCQEETDREVRTFAGQIKNTAKTLETLKINFSGKNFKRPRHLQLNLADLKKLTDKGFKDLATQIRNTSRKLQLLDLDFSRGVSVNKESFKEEILKDFVTRFGKNHTSLQHLCLRFKFRSIMTDEVLKLLVTHIEKNFPNLQHMDLCFYHTSLTDQGVINLASHFKDSFQKLRFLKLDFYKNNIQDKGVEELATQILLNLKELRKLDLNFAFHKSVTDKGVIGLAGVFRYSSKTLKSLKLDFHLCGITDASLGFLGAQIQTHLGLLQELFLSFASCRSVTDQGVKDLMDKIGQNLNSLEKITFEFGHNENVTNEAAKAIGTLMGNYAKTLQSITLSFNCCFNLNINGIKALTCQEFKSLRSYKLDFLDVYDLERDESNKVYDTFWKKHKKTLEYYNINGTNRFKYDC